MLKPKLHKTKHGTVLGVEASLDQIKEWRPTIAGVRDCVLHNFVTGLDLSPYLPDGSPGRRLYPTPSEIDAINEAARDAVTSGRVIDFGNLPNEVIKEGGVRGGPLWNMGAIGMPFRDPWLLYHTWDGLVGIPRESEWPAVSVYLVNLINRDKPAGGESEICELSPVKVQGQPVLLMSDRVILFEHDPEDREGATRYHCASAPSQWRFMPGADTVNLGASPESACAGNVGDPLMTALMILNTRNIGRETVSAPAKLNRARMKSGKLPIPPYDRIDSKPYVTAILARKAGRSEPKGGHHASPQPHLRIGHIREYKTGARTFVRDTLVNVTNEARAAFIRSRSHYTIDKTSR